MRLAAIGGHFHWSRAELEALTPDDLRFWNNAAAELHERQRKG